MFGPCWDHVLPSSATRPARALKFSRLSQHGLSPMSMVCQLFGAMSWPCVDYVWPKSTSRPARALIFQGWSQLGMRNISMKYSAYRFMTKADELEKMQRAQFFWL